MSGAATPQSVDGYISSFPVETRERLLAIRTVIHAEAPDATEKMSYGLPTFVLDRKNLIHLKLLSLCTILQVLDPSLQKYVDSVSGRNGINQANNIWMRSDCGKDLYFLDQISGSTHDVPAHIKNRSDLHHHWFVWRLEEHILLVKRNGFLFAGSFEEFGAATPDLEFLEVLSIWFIFPMR